MLESPLAGSASNQSQPAQHFLQWLDKNCCGVYGSTEDGSEPPKERIVSSIALKSYFAPPHRLGDLLRACGFSGETSTVTPRYVRTNHIKTFAILLSIGEGNWIGHFAEQDALRDSHLPFWTCPPSFPKDPSKDPSSDLWARSITWQDEEILPITFKAPLDKGGSARTFKVKIHPDFNHLPFRQGEKPDPASPKPEYVVLKTYTSNDAAKNYQHELDAFLHLRDRANRRTSNLIGFYGSYKHRGTFNIILEYADMGNLEDYLRNTPHPTERGDIYHFWKSLLQITAAVRRIHNVREQESDEHQDPTSPDRGRQRALQGWHQDIKPKNILVVSKQGGSEYDCDFKLADLGLCHFKRAATDSDFQGTRTYGPPEAYKYDKNVERYPFHISQAFDIWSIGCVLSEAATWVIHGSRGLDQYRLARQAEIKTIPDHTDKDCFHNKSTVLPGVVEHHEKLLQDRRRHDKITKLVLKLIDDMLDEEEDRPDAAQVHKWSLKHLEQSKRQLESRHSNGENHLEQPIFHDRNPSPAYHSPFDHSPGPSTARNHAQGDSFSARIGRDPFRDSSLPTYTEHTQRTAEPERSSVSMGNSDTPTRGPRQSTHTLHTPSIDSIPEPIAYNGEPRLISQRPLSGTDVPYADESSPPSGQPEVAFGSEATSSQYLRHPSYSLPTRQRYHRAVSDGSLGNFPEQRQWDQQMPSDTARDAQYVSYSGVEHLASGETNQLGSYQQDSYQPRGGLISESSNDLVAVPSRPEPKFCSVEEATVWRNSHADIPLKDGYQKLELKNRNHVFLVDESSSMRQYWPEVKNLVDVLGYILKELDPDGLDLYFTMNWHKRYHSKKTKELRNAVDKHKPEQIDNLDDARYSNIYHGLESILGDYKKKLGQKWRIMKVKPISIYVLTDGLWAPNSDADTPVIEIVKALEKHELPQNQVGIQFIRLGTSTEGKARLDRLDALNTVYGLPRDIVNTESAQGNVWKMLLGAINKWYDSGGNLKAT